MQPLKGTENSTSYRDFPVFRDGEAAMEKKNTTKILKDKKENFRFPFSCSLAELNILNEPVNERA